MSPRRLVIAIILTVTTLTTGCPRPILSTQQSLAQRVHAAATQCRSLPVGGTKTEVCARAGLCQSQALLAAEAMQRAQLARASGETDVAAETSAAGLDVLADSACCAWATKPCKTAMP